MRTLEYMIENHESIGLETTYQAQFETYYVAARRCKRDHPPIRMVKGGACAICNRDRGRAAAAKRNARLEPERRKQREAEAREKERVIVMMQERETARSIKHQCETLDKIKTGVLFLVKGRCAL